MFPVTLPAAVGENTTFRVTDAEGFRVNGTVKPFTEKPAFPLVMVEICTAAVPVLVRVTCCVELVPVETVPKAREAALACNWPTGEFDPVPARFTVMVGLVGSLLVIVSVPDVDPLDVGWNDSESSTDCPALMVLGVVIPPTPKSEPVTESIETVKSELPAFEIVRLALPVDPTLTVPNCTEVLLREICGPAVTAVAVRFTVCGELPSLPWTVIVPVTFPAAVGETATVRLLAWPVAIAIGNAAPDRLNCGLEKVACVMEIEVLPVLVTDTTWMPCFPTPTFPKFTLLGLSWKTAWSVVLVALTSPEQPLRKPTKQRDARTRSEKRSRWYLWYFASCPGCLASANPPICMTRPSALLITE